MFSAMEFSHRYLCLLGNLPLDLYFTYYFRSNF